MNSIYLDHNATTPLLPEVWEAMLPFWRERFGNPASSHYAGRQARQALEDARDLVAALLDSQPDEVLFTSGATEANNLALLGFSHAPPGRIVSSPLEHPCVVEPIRRLVDAGFDYEALPVDRQGSVTAPNEAPAPDTRLVSVMFANHETGALQPIESLVAHYGPTVAFHCDAAAAVGKRPVSFAKLGVSSLTISAHKFHGPKGIGALLLRRHAKLKPLLWGGHQQQGKRPGTEAVALAVGMAKALEIATQNLETHQAKVWALRQSFLRILRCQAAPITVNGSELDGVPHTLNVSFPGCRADALLMNFDLAGVACSTGSACTSGSLLPSPVLQAMQVEAALLHSAMRFSFSPHLTEAEIEEAARRITKIVNRLRQ